MSQDLYDILGVDKGADAKAIKAAYRKLAKQLHPDQNKGDEAAADRFKKINAAYEVLSDADKRAAYDRMGPAAFAQGGMGGGARPGGQGFEGFSGGGFADIFEEMFGAMGGGGRGGGSGGGRRAARGNDVQYRLDITLADAFAGTEETIRFPVNATCETCGGTGAKKGSGDTTCEQCGGRGRVRQQQGFFTIERTCPACGGTGSVIKDPCTACRGSGQVRKNKSLRVKVPAGIESGQRIRLSGEGEGGLRGGRAGDLYVLIAVRPHEFFERDGSDLYCRVPVAITTAALGGSAQVPTIDGKPTSVKIPAGAQTGQRLRLRGKGMRVAGRAGARGDMFVDLAVEVPVALSGEQRALLSKLDRSLGKRAAKHCPKSAGFAQRVGKG